MRESHFFAQDPEAKTQKVQQIFGQVSGVYDLMNDVLSLGLHRVWKKEFVAHLPLAQLPPSQLTPSHISCAQPLPLILDMATGTGDIPVHIKVRAKGEGLGLQYLLCDLNLDMLSVGKKRCARSGQGNDCLKSEDQSSADQGEQEFHWICSNGENLPLPDHAIGLYTIAFGLRNVTDKARLLGEAYRVLQNGGFFYCLEFTHPTSPWIAGLYHLHSRWLIPALGALIANNRKAYTYLVESIENFPPPALLRSMIQEAGFSHTGFLRLAPGIVCVHWGQKITDRRA